MWKRRNLLIVAGLLVIAGIAWLLVSQSNGTSEASETAIVQRTTLDITVEGSGTVSGERTVLLSFGVSDVVTRIDVEAGDMVNEGQPLAAVDTSDLELQVELAEQAVAAQQAAYDQLIQGATEEEIAQARAAVEQAQANLDSAIAARDLNVDRITIECASLATAQDNLDSAQEAYEDYVLSALELDPTFVPDPDSEAGQALDDAQTAHDVALAQCDIATSQTTDEGAVDAAQAALDQAQAQLDSLLAGATQAQIDAASANLETAQLQLQQAQNRLEDARLLAPFDGLVTDVNITQGQQVSPNTVAITVVDTSQLHVDVSVDELDIPYVALGQPATVRLDAMPNLPQEGVVAHIAPAGRVEQGIVNYTVRVDLPNPAPQVRLGMSTDVDILVDTIEDALVVPREAIQRDDELGEHVLVQQPGGGVVSVPVTTGATTEGYISIEGNLSADQVVLLSPPSTRRTGLFGR